MLNKEILDGIKGYTSRDGYVNICSMKKHEYDNCGLFTMTTPSGHMMFGKETADKAIIDAEVLMSAIYDKMGIKTPIYLPYADRHSMGVISEHVESFDTTASTVAKIQQLQGIKLYNQFYIHNLISNPEVQKNITREAIGDIVDMNRMDIASQNTDRSSYNMFLGSRKPDGRYSSAISIDYGMTAGRFAKFGYVDDDYYINMSKTGTGRYIYICEMCDQKDWYGYTTPIEFIKKLDGINVAEIARDIKEQFGYAIDRRYIQYIQDIYKDFINTTNEVINY